MAMNYEKLGQPHVDNYREGINRVNGFVKSLVEQGLLPERFPETSLNQTAGELEIPTVSEALHNKTREVLAELGYTFVVDISPISIGQLVADRAVSQRFDYICYPLERMQSNVPLQMKVAIDPNNFRIDNTNNLSTDRQIGEIRKQESILKAKLPENVRDVISMLKPPKHASILVQLDFEHQKRTGEVLFTDWFGRTDEETIPGHVAHVGRGDPTRGFHIGDWSRVNGDEDVFAVSVVMLPWKLAV